jgi:hypothetical protein
VRQRRVTDASAVLPGQGVNMTLPDLVALIMVDRMAALGPWCQHKCPWGANTTTRIQSNSELEKHCHYLHKNRVMRVGAFDEFTVDCAVDDELKSAISRTRLGRVEASYRSELETGSRGPPPCTEQDPLCIHGPGAGAHVGHQLSVRGHFASRMPRPGSCARLGWTQVRAICFRVAALYARNSQWPSERSLMPRVGLRSVTENY